MPTHIDMLTLQMAGHELGNLWGTSMPGNISIVMQGNKMIIRQKNIEVFSMKTVRVVDDTLLLDFPKTAAGQDGRGWGFMAMLIALFHGQQRKCTNIELATQIEHTPASLSFWSKFGITRMKGNSLATALERGIQWVVEKCPQSDTITDFVLRDPKPTS